MGNEVSGRNPGFDVLRGGALALMVMAHFSRTIPATGGVSAGISLVGETAPAFFFFAFGLTFERFLRKPSSFKWRQTVLFLYVAVMHNIFLRDWYVSDFLAFLLLWRTVLWGTSTLGTWHKKLWTFLSLGVLVALVISPEPMMRRAFQGVIPGPFPLMPWGLFILAGWLQGQLSVVKRGCVGVGATALGLGLLVGAQWGGFSYWEFDKWPMTSSYFLLLTGVGLLTLSAIEYRHQRRRLRLWEPVTFLSKNLLLATVVHYVPVMILKEITPRLIPVASLDGNLGALVIVAGSVVCVVVTYWLVRLLLLVWQRLQGTRPLEAFVSVYDVVALGGIVVSAVWLGANGINGMQELGVGRWVQVLRIPVWGMMVVFALVMQSKRKTAR